MTDFLKNLSKFNIYIDTRQYKNAIDFLYSHLPEIEVYLNNYLINPIHNLNVTKINNNSTLIQKYNMYYTKLHNNNNSDNNDNINFLIANIFCYSIHIIINNYNK